MEATAEEVAAVAKVAEAAVMMNLEAATEKSEAQACATAMPLAVVPQVASYLRGKRCVERTAVLAMAADLV